MACRNPALRGALPICEMSLRALPAEVRSPSGHLVLIDPERWWKHVNEDEECLCHRPDREWCHSPLGAAVEINFASADHLLCLPVSTPRAELIPHAHPGIAAESLFADGNIAEFVRVVRTSPAAVAHLLSIQKSFYSDGGLVECQHFVRSLLANDAARDALR